MLCRFIRKYVGRRNIYYKYIYIVGGIDRQIITKAYCTNFAELFGQSNRYIDR